MRADEGKRQEPERLPNLFVPAGSILIRLSAGKGDGNPDEPYRLTVASHRPEAGAEREPNNTSATATPLPAGASGNGLLYPKGDVDFWQAPPPPTPRARSRSPSPAIAGMALDVRALTLASREDRRASRSTAMRRSPTAWRSAPSRAACCKCARRAGKAANFRDRYTVTVGR